MARDPVCGMEIDEDMAEDLGAEILELDGVTYYFCSPFCREQFEKDPQRYLTQGPDDHKFHQ